MSKLRRHYSEGNAYFITNVTIDRKQILVDNADLLREAIHHFATNSNIQTTAWVILPDHFHLIIDPAGEDLSNLLRKIKLSFSSSYRKRIGVRSGRMWQYRFYDHVIRDQEDMNRHIDYIHYNPVKHGLVVRPADYPHSSFQSYCQGGLYTPDWGSTEPIEFDGQFGE